MGQFYQQRDGHLIDYELYAFGDRYLRGPPPSRSDYIACVGAAQTFGTYCTRPYGNILRDMLEVDCLNLGIGGKGPSYFAGDESILKAVNRAQLVIVQVMSGRSDSNSAYQSIEGGNRGLRLADGKPLKARDFYLDLITGCDPRGRIPGYLMSVVRETRENYLAATIELLGKIRRPKILFWFSVRPPHYVDANPSRSIRNLVSWLDTLSGGKRKLLLRYANKALSRLFREFPQLVNAEMIDRLRPHADHYVECISNAGLPQRLVDIHGNFVGENAYYPSPEMHVQAAAMLQPICRDILARSE